MKISLSILAGTVLATALFSSLTACSEEPPTGAGTGGTGAAPSAGGTGGQSGSAGSGGTSGQGAAGSSAAGSSAAGSSAGAGRSSGGAAGTCSIMARADPIAGASGGGGMSGGGGRGGGAAGMSGASSGGASSGGMSAGGMSSGGTSSGGASSGGMSAGGSAGMSTDPYPPTWENLKFVLTATNPPCTASDCHGLNGPNVLQFTVKDDALLWKNISERVSTQCGNIKVVDPGHPETSALVKIIKESCTGPCGITPRMPKDCVDTGTCLDNDVISSIEKWVAAGAPHP